jgi:hypothetical protein
MDKIGMIVKMHFGDRLFCCEKCADYRTGTCKGEGLRGYKLIRRCMEKKDIQLVSSSGFVGFDY